MDEYVIELPAVALGELSRGTSLVIEVDDARVVIKCDESAVAHFRAQVHWALLNQLPVSPTQH